MFVATYRKYWGEYKNLKRTVYGGFLDGRGWGFWAKNNLS